MICRKYYLFRAEVQLGFEDFVIEVNLMRLCSEEGSDDGRVWLLRYLAEEFDYW